MGVDGAERADPRPVPRSSGAGPTPPRRRSVVSFADRGGRMTAGQQRAWERLWPRYGADLADLDGPLDARSWFGRAAPLRLEIGSGMGETTALLAAAEPNADHVAVEVYPPGLAQLLMRLDATGLENLRLVRGDAVVLLADHVAPASLDGLRVYYPDPWPKRRHHKRRIVQPSSLALLASRLRPGATLHLATDIADYAEWMREVADAEPGLTRHPDAGADGFVPRPSWRPRTKFETRAEEQGRPSRDLLLVRTDGPAGPWGLA